MPRCANYFFAKRIARSSSSSSFFFVFNLPTTVTYLIAMAAPSEAFPLANRPSGLPRVTPFLVKVTDSGLKSLQDALQSKSPTGLSEGQIVFGANTRPFKFTVSDMQQDTGAKGPLEAAEQFVSDGRWCKLGLMRYRATIMATDDSYQSTKRKALQAEQDAKKASAKVKSSVKIWNKVNDAASAMTRCQRMPLRAVSSSECKTTSSISKPSSQKAPTANQRGLDVTKKTLRERVIHHLLIRSCSPKELLSRLVKEGLSADERQNFESTFDAVAQVKSQTSSNGLKQQCLSEVSDEWPFYSSWDRQVAKRALAARLSLGSKRENCTNVPLEMVPKKEESKKSRPVAGSSGSSKAKHTQGARSILDDLLPSDNDYAAPVAKQQKVSTQVCEKVAPPSSSSSSMLRKEPGFGGEPLAQPPPPPQDKAKVPVNSSHITKSSNGYESGQRKRPHNADSDGHDSSTTSTESHSSSSNNTCYNKKGKSSVSLNSPPLDAALLDEYPVIETLQERQKYKELFDRDYPKYLKFYGKLSTIAREFLELGEKLRETDQGSAEYAAIEREICDRYRRFREDPALDGLRKQHDSIRAKLAAIKSRVVSFDKRHQCEIEEADDSD
ncbi:ubiquinol cytochrome c reductase [Trichuris trichiura]|uniref:Ubiquinol cytochrome c reductase n=1 Tax=Trichuris trichiura TaxID=36087 RepID=A0A077Z6Z9_TRITR|nr:ubiquinol cytochrome c reductase [Trichuris trichiura]